MRVAQIASVALFSALLVGCSWSTVRDHGGSTADGPATPRRVAGNTAAPAGSAAINPDAPEKPFQTPEIPEHHGAPRLLIDELVGVSPSAAGLVFDPTVDGVEHCQGTTGSFLKLTFKSDGDDTSIKVDPSSTANRSARACVLRALSLHDAAAAIQQDGRSIKRGMRSQITVRW